MQKIIEEKSRQLMMSQTMERLHQIALGFDFDVTKPGELRTMLATCGNDVVLALDAGRIHFDSAADKAMFYGLLTVTTDYVMGGRLRTAFVEVRRN
jgi:hypothetical protein